MNQVFIRDDRRVLAELKLCEVEVLGRSFNAGNFSSLIRETKLCLIEYDFGDFFLISYHKLLETLAVVFISFFIYKDSLSTLCILRVVLIFFFPFCAVHRNCPPVSLRNGQTLVKNTKSGGGWSKSTVQFKCSPGFLLWGNAEAHCLFDGR